MFSHVLQKLSVEDLGRLKEHRRRIGSIKSTLFFTTQIIYYGYIQYGNLETLDISIYTIAIYRNTTFIGNFTVIEWNFKSDFSWDLIGCPGT